MLRINLRKTTSKKQKIKQKGERYSSPFLVFTVCRYCIFQNVRPFIPAEHGKSLYRSFQKQAVRLQT